MYTNKDGKKLHEVKESWARGYVSRRPNPDGSYGWSEEYHGRYGDGIKKHLPSWESTSYHVVEYWVE